MKQYTQVKSRNSVTTRTGRRVEVKTKIPPNTCHPGANIEFRSQGTPPTWNCAACGKVLLTETPVNSAVITEYD